MDNPSSGDEAINPTMKRGGVGDCGKPKELDVGHHDGTFEGFEIDHHLKPGQKTHSAKNYGAMGGMGSGGDCSYGK